MNISMSFIRSFFILLSVVITTAYVTTATPFESLSLRLALGVVGGALFALSLVFTAKMVRRFNLRSFNIAMLGLWVGYLMGQAVILVIDGAIDLPDDVARPLFAGIVLFAAYIGMVMTARASENLLVSLPFVKLSPGQTRKRDVVLDTSALCDTRLIDLAASGLLDHHLVLPRVFVNELYELQDDPDESHRTRARRALETLKKLESLPTLGMRYTDTDLHDIKDPLQKALKIARILDANLLTSDISRIQQSAVEDVTVINMHNLSNALKPLMQSGETIEIKIQRIGKEPKQGIGYLGDGTMVVVNGGGDYITKVIKAQVLSVKHTSSGRMIFCNAMADIAQDSCQPAMTTSASRDDFFA